MGTSAFKRFQDHTGWTTPKPADLAPVLPELEAAVISTLENLFSQVNWEVDLTPSLTLAFYWVQNLSVPLAPQLLTVVGHWEDLMQRNLMNLHYHVRRLPKYVKEFHFVLPFLLLQARLILDIIWKGEYHIPLLLPRIRLVCARAVLHEFSAMGHCCIEVPRISGLDKPLFF